MMKVAINILPLQSGHKTRGIGLYTRNLIEALEASQIVELIKFSNLKEVSGVDLVHYPWFDLFYRSMPFGKPFPTIVTIHDIIPLIFPGHYPVGLRGKINFYLQKFSLKSCKFIITDSKKSGEDIGKFLKIPQSRIKVIPLAAQDCFKLLSDASKLHIKRKYHLPDNFIMYVGDCNFVKNLPFLIEGFISLRENRQFSQIKLVLVGGVFLKKVEKIDHPELDSLKQVNRLINQYGLEEVIIRPGQLGSADLVGFYNLATVYIQPSLYEGFGLPVIEAFACGCPVVCSNAGSLKEVGGKAAVYFDPQTSDQFLSVVAQVLQSQSLQAKLSRLGLKQAAKFSWGKVADETVKVYEQAAGI